MSRFCHSRIRTGRVVSWAAVLAALALSAALPSCLPSGPGSETSPEAGPADPAERPVSPDGPPSADPRPETAVFEYSYTSVRIPDPGSVRYRMEFRFHPDGTIRSAELREYRADSETLLATAESEPQGGGYRVSYRSLGRDASAYSYSLGRSDRGLVVKVGEEVTGFRYDTAERVFTIPWENGSETYAFEPDGSVRAERILSAKKEWSARLYRRDGDLRYQDYFSDGEVDRELLMKRSGPDAWAIDFTGSADSYYEGRLSGASLFPKGGAFPAAFYNLLIVMDFYMMEERFPFFCLSLLE